MPIYANIDIFKNPLTADDLGVPSLNKQWISYNPDSCLRQKTLGYKCHITIPKENKENYKTWVKTITMILIRNGFNFKYDNILDEDILGERAFTIYRVTDVHNYMSVFREIDDLLTEKGVSKCVATQTSRPVAKLNHFTYRNDEENGKYYNGLFREADAKNIYNPFDEKTIQKCFEQTPLPLEKFREILNEYNKAKGFFFCSYRSTTMQRLDSLYHEQKSSGKRTVYPHEIESCIEYQRTAFFYNPTTGKATLDTDKVLEKLGKAIQAIPASTSKLSHASS